MSHDHGHVVDVVHPGARLAGKPPIVQVYKRRHAFRRRFSSRGGVAIIVARGAVSTDDAGDFGGGELGEKNGDGLSTAWTQHRRETSRMLSRPINGQTSAAKQVTAVSLYGELRIGQTYRTLTILIMRTHVGSGLWRAGENKRQ